MQPEMGEEAAAGAAPIHIKHMMDRPMIQHLLKIRFKGWSPRDTTALWEQWVNLSTPKAQATTLEEAAMLQEEEAADLEEVDKDIHMK